MRHGAESPSGWWRNKGYLWSLSNFFWKYKIDSVAFFQFSIPLLPSSWFGEWPCIRCSVFCVLQPQAKYAPARARLNLQGSSKGYGAWCSKTNDGKQWLQIDFGELVQVTKVATQGQQDGNHWVTKFTLSYSMDGIHWAEYKENSVTWVSDNHQLLHSWTKLMRQFHLIFFNFCPTGASPQNRKE